MEPQEADAAGDRPASERGHRREGGLVFAEADERQAR